MHRTKIKLLLMVLILLPLAIMGTEKTVIDLKVPLAETAELAPAQAGATVYLMQSDWASVSELKEDVAVWLTDYDRKKNLIGQQVVSLTLEVREPSGIRIGNLLDKKDITVRYWNKKPDTTRFKQQILNDLDDLSQDLQIEAYFLGVKIESVLHSILK